VQVTTASPFTRLDIEGGANQMGAIAHDPQSNARFGADHRWKRRAVVADGEDERVPAVSKLDFDMSGLRMFDGVGHGFLGDFVKLTDSIGFKRGNRGLAPELA